MFRVSAFTCAESSSFWKSVDQAVKSIMCSHSLLCFLEKTVLYPQQPFIRKISQNLRFYFDETQIINKIQTIVKSPLPIKTNEQHETVMRVIQMCKIACQSNKWNTSTRSPVPFAAELSCLKSTTLVCAVLAFTKLKNVPSPIDDFRKWFVKHQTEHQLNAMQYIFNKWRLNTMSDQFVQSIVTVSQFTHL